MKQLKVVEAFAGYGSQRMALKKLGINTVNSKIIEWSINPILAYANTHDKERYEAYKESFDKVYKGNKEMLIHDILSKFTLSTETKKVDGEYVPCDYNQYKRMSYDRLIEILAACVASKNLGSIMEARGGELNDTDLFTYSFPCQDLSLAGKQRGISSTTRSGLLFQVERMLKEQEAHLRPKVLVMENVKNLVGKKFKPQFDEWVETLKELGYETQWKVLNAIEHGIPQSRERVFAVSIRRDSNINFSFDNVETKELTKFIKDFLVDGVEENLYISSEHVNNVLTLHNLERELTTEQILNNKNLILGINPTSPVYQSDNVVHGQNSYVSTLRAGNGTQLIAIQEDLKSPIKIRSIIQREALRLMGVNEEDINSMFEVVSTKTAQYKLAGNSIVVNVLEDLFRAIEW